MYLTLKDETTDPGSGTALKGKKTPPFLSAPGVDV
jgi:hypothetical protein